MCSQECALKKIVYVYVHQKQGFFLFQPPEDIHTLKSKQECSHSLLWMVIYRLHKMIQPSNKHTPDFALSVCAKSRWLNPQPNRISSVSVSVHTLNVGGTFLFRRQQSLGKYDSSYTHLCKRLLKKSAKCVNSGDSGKIAFLSFVTQAVEMEKKNPMGVVHHFMPYIQTKRPLSNIFSFHLWNSQCFLLLSGNKIKTTKEKLHHSKLSNNTPLLRKHTPTTLHTAHFLNPSCHTSASSARYLLCPTALPKPPCSIFTSSSHWYAAFWEFVSYSNHMSLLPSKKANSRTQRCLHVCKRHAVLLFVRKVIFSIHHPPVHHPLNLHLL